MTLLFNKVLRHRCPNDVQALVAPAYGKFPAFERLDVVYFGVARPPRLRTH
jgi:hypothetical protein